MHKTLCSFFCDVFETEEAEAEAQLWCVVNFYGQA